MKSDPHIQLRNTLLDDHFRHGWVDSDMVVAYMLMLRHCDWATGIWQGSAPALVYLSNEQWSPSVAKRILKQLGDGGYITSAHVRGVRGNYSIFINNYVVPSGVNKGKKLRPTKTRNWKTIKPKSEPMGEPVQAHQRAATGSKVSPPVARNQDTPKEGVPSGGGLSGYEFCGDGECVQDKVKGQSINQSIEQGVPASPSHEEFLHDGWIPTGKQFEPYQVTMDTLIMEGDLDKEAEGRFWDRVTALKLSWLRTEWNKIWRTIEPSREDLELFYQVAKTCDENCCFPIDLIAYRENHQKGSLLAGLKSPKGLHKAVVNGDKFNGLMVQYKDHDLTTCRTCMAKQRQMDKAEPEYRRAAGKRTNWLKPLTNSPRSGHFSIGADSVCCDCQAEGQNVDSGVRCKPCRDKFVVEMGKNMDFEKEEV